ncbi:Spindle pole body component alp4 [Rhizoctonia solani]|uniref:Spindle pole body component n=2 Tax=Rhizoctonia solani TaxID=456999 RepID=A0A0K6G4J3_9AGAM|nr:Spindle pole body component alp4 [Rhizoctonia solani]
MGSSIQGLNSGLALDGKPVDFQCRHTKAHQTAEDKDIAIIHNYVIRYPDPPTNTNIVIVQTTMSIRYSRPASRATIPSNTYSKRSGDVRAQDASFTAETSFVHAPLNSRVQKATNHERERAPSLRDVPLEIQEAFMLEDMLSVLLGIDGIYVARVGPDEPAQFAVDSGLDPALRDLVGRMLPLATHYCACVGFVEARAHIDFGSVCHALCAAVRSVLKDYTTLITQLEHLFHTSPAFSLQQLWFHVHPVMRTLSLIHSIADDIQSPPTASLTPSSSAASDDEEDEEERKKNEELGLGGVKAVLMGVGVGVEEAGSVQGGEVIGILWDRWVAMSGDPPASALLRKLLTAASAPYAQILRTWTHHGTLHDPHGEFFVRARVGAGEGAKGGGGTREDYTDEYWERRYTLRDGSHAPHPSTAASTGQSALSAAPPPSALVPRPRIPGGRLPGGACVPPSLEGWKHKVLLAGKYLNVVREWGGDAAGVKLGLKEFENRAKGIDKDQEDDDEGTERGGSRASSRKRRGSTVDKPKLSNEEDSAGSGDGAMDTPSFYKTVEDAYTYANKTLLKVLMEDQMLVPRLRSLKYYFFLPRSSFLTHFLDLAHLELRKPPKSANLVKLQSLLDLAISGPEEPSGFGSASVVSGVGGFGASSSATESMVDTPSFREDVKISMASSGLYEWLLKVVSVSGAIDDTGGAGNEEQFAASRSRKSKDGKDDKEKKKKSAPALDHLTLDYTVPFPLSLVISRKTILRYQLLFRFLLHLKHVEQMLGGMWVEQMLGAWRHPVITRAGSALESRSVSRAESRASHHSGPSSAHPNNPGAQSSLPSTIPNPNHPHSSHYPTPLHADFERWRRRVFLLRARMLSFVQQILAFATFEVLEPNWKALEKRLERVSTVDQVLRDHVDFLDTCLKECMLTSAKLLRVYSNLLVTISMFAQYASSFTRSARDVLTAMEQEANGEAAGKPVDMKKEWSFLNRFEQNFNHSFKVHLDVVSFYASSENVTLLSLVTRLNSVRSMN